MGEIIPAAILTGPKQLEIAAACVPLVYVVAFIFSPIAYPFSLILDQILGHDEGMTTYNRYATSSLAFFFKPLLPAIFLLPIYLPTE